MKNQRYSLLSTMLISAIHPNEPQAAGTVWEPTNAIDIQEAELLCKAGYAEHTTASKDDVVTATKLQREDAKPASAPVNENPADTGDDLDDEMLALILDGSVENVAAELDGLSAEQLKRLVQLERKGKDRKGVHEAIAAAIEE